MKLLLKKRRSQKQESNVAVRFKGKTVVASGSKWAAKGDVRTDDYLIEVKYTDNTYYTLKWDTWKKIEREALSDHGRIPLMFIDIARVEYVVFKADDFDVQVDNIPNNLNRSIRISFSTCGADNFGNYCHMFQCRLTDTLLCVMLYEDFVREYGGNFNG